jgi:hypothetical protein
MPTYERAMYYTVQIDGKSFECADLREALELFRRLQATRSDTICTMNLVAWAGRSNRDGGPPTGLILEQHTWDTDGDLR